MARKNESVGMMISLVLCSFIIIGLAVTCYMLVSSNAQKDTSITSLTAAKTAEQNKAKSFEYLANCAKLTIGQSQLTEQQLDEIAQSLPAASRTEGEAIIAEFNNRVEQWKAIVGDANAVNYLTIPDALMAQVQDRTLRYNTEKAAKESTETDLAKAESADWMQTKTQLAQLDTNVLQAIQDETKAYNDGRTAAQQTFQSGMSPYKTSLDGLQQQVSDANQTATQAAAVTKELTNELAEKKLRETPKSERFEIPDGRITQVHQASNTVWLDLGSAEGLRPLTTFAVYDHEEIGVMRSPNDIKGRIEITKIMGPHRAEGRIVEDYLRNPIADGDQVHSPTWFKGRPVHFALIGFYDLDGDKSGDRQKVITMIHAAGGKVDAELSVDSTTDGAEIIAKGQFTVDTRYAVLGDLSVLQNRAPDVFNQFMQRIQTQNIEQITVNSLLNYAGVKLEAFSVDRRSGSGLEYQKDRPLVKPQPQEEAKRNQRIPPPRGESDGAF